MQKTWFFYKVLGTAYELVDTKICIEPNRTRVYEDLKSDFNSQIIQGYGYTDNINDIN